MFYLSYVFKIAKYIFFVNWVKYKILKHFRLFSTEKNIYINLILPNLTYSNLTYPTDTKCIQNAFARWKMWKIHTSIIHCI